MNEQDNSRQVVRFGNIRVEQGRGYQNVSFDNTENFNKAQQRRRTNQQNVLHSKSAMKALDTVFGKAAAITFAALIIAISVILGIITRESSVSLLFLIPLILYLAGFAGYRIFFRKQFNLYPDLDTHIAAIIRERNGIITPSDLTARVGMPLDEARNKLDSLAKENYLYLDFDENGTLFYRTSDMIK